jgi:O-antigen/teichoic acid export membrane protein
MLTGALIGVVAALGVAIWHNRDLLSMQVPRFDAKPLLKRLMPLTVGCGVSQFLFSADLIVVQSGFEDTAPYVFGGTLARAIVIFTAPLVAVMFPKIVHSAVRQQENKLMLLTLGFTFLLASCAAFGLTLTAPLIIRLGSKPEYTSFVPLIPWFAWSMVPLAVGNVLLNNLMAHSKFKCVPALLLVSIGYWVALKFFGISFKTVILTCGAFNTIFLLVTFLFTWLAMPESLVRTRFQPSPVIE